MPYAHIVGIVEDDGSLTRMVLGCEAMATSMVEFLVRSSDRDGILLDWQDTEGLERSDEEIARAQEWAKKFHNSRH